MLYANLMDAALQVLTICSTL